MKRRRTPSVNPVLSHPAFWLLSALVCLALLVNIFLHSHTSVLERINSRGNNILPREDNPLHQAPHLTPRLPPLPIFPTIDDKEELIHQTLHENKPTIAGIAAILYNFLSELHQSNENLATSTHTSVREIQSTYFRLVQKHLVPLDKAYEGRPVFEVRTDDSIFVSVAAFREYLLADTLQSLYSSAKHPDKLFVGVIVNNCFEGNNCQGGVKVVGKDRNGKDKLQKVNGVPDINHIETFCNNSTFQPYCQSGQVRVLYINETEALGPSVARYYSSKLWGGETYYVQIDSHLHFATHWDELYIQDLQSAKSYPNAILSTYPPGFVNFRQDPPFTPGTRLCKCQMRQQEGWLPRVEMEGRCHEDEARPTQMAFMGAGFFFTRADLLVDVKLDPFLGWMFMGEEIALSIRAWTHGWNIYAPRKNLIGHQYRPIKFGAPLYWNSVARIFHQQGLVDKATTHIRKRIKYMMGYPGLEIEEDNDALLELEHYGLGKDRSREDYLEFAEIDLEQKTCGPMKWCAEGLLE